jgi:carotenoid cleavage dioxygenase-like enzyme
MSLKTIAMPKAENSTGPQTSSSNTWAEGSLCQDFAPGLEAAFPDCFPESDGLLEVSEGYIPDYVRGTWYLNGPARFKRNGLDYRHWLDGDGMICAVHFDNNGIRFKSRYIRSRKLSDEENAGRPLFRTFGTTFQGSQMNRVGNALESPVNVSVYAMGDRLLACGEQGLPWELDPETLETRGQFTFNGRLNDASPFSAHPKFDSNSGEMFNFGIFFSMQVPRLYFYRFDPDGLRYRKAVPLEYPCSIHDFSLSKNYAAFYLSPYLLHVADLLQCERTVMDCLRWAPERGSKLLILARDTGNVVASIPLGNRYCLHLINSFEEDGRLKVDVLEFDEPLYIHYQPVPALFENVPSGGPVRYVVDLQSRELVERIAANYSSAPDFPAVDPRFAMRSYDEFWMLGISSAGNPGRKFFDQLVHGRWNQNEACDVYQSPPMRYLGGEPAFVNPPGSGSSESVVICQEFDSSERLSYLAFFDPRRVQDGPLGRIALNRAIYLGFHGAFRPKQ